jgi:large conductance mechanosensitive channel
VIILKGFIEFVRTQGVVGLAVGFILGGAVSKVVTSIVTDLVNPILGLLLGATKGLETATVKVGSAQMLVGHFASTLIDFIVIALVVYFGVRALKLDKLDQKKS